MELEFFLPYINELKRLDRADDKKKAPVCTALDRFYSSDLFDSNVLGVIGEYFKPRYVVEDIDCLYDWTITNVSIEYKGIRAEINIWTDNIDTSRYMRLDSPIIIYADRNRNAIESILSHDTYKEFTVRKQCVIKKAVEAILADPNIFP